MGTFLTWTLGISAGVFLLTAMFHIMDRHFTALYEKEVKLQKRSIGDIKIYDKENDGHGHSARRI